MGASVLTAAALLFTWGRDATWIKSNERRKQPLNAVLEIVPIIVPPRKNFSVSITTGILNGDKQGEEILSHVFTVCQLGCQQCLSKFSSQASRICHARYWMPFKPMHTPRYVTHYGVPSGISAKNQSRPQHSTSFLFSPSPLPRVKSPLP